MDLLRLAGALLFASIAGPANAAVLYKSVSPEGTIQFSDLPPEKTARTVERIVMPDSSSPGSSGSSTTLAAGPTREEQLQAELAVQRASMQVDMAEHALAVARRSVWSEPDPLRFNATRMTRADVERTEFFKKNVLVARQMLLEVLQQKRRTDAPQTYTASNVWVPVK